MIFKANYENICHWNQWVSNSATNGWWRYRGCPRGVVGDGGSGFLSPQEESRPLDIKQGATGYRNVNR